MCLGSPTRKLFDLQTAVNKPRPVEMRVMDQFVISHRRAVPSFGKGISAQLFSIKRSPARFLGAMYACIFGGRPSVTAWRSIATG